MHMLGPVSSYVLRRQTSQRDEWKWGFPAEEETSAVLVEVQRWPTSNALARDYLQPCGSSPRQEQGFMVQISYLKLHHLWNIKASGSNWLSATEHLLRSPLLPKSSPTLRRGQRLWVWHLSHVRQGGLAAVPVHPWLASATLQKKKWPDLPGRHQGRQQKAIFGKHFLPPDITLVGEEAVSSTRRGRGSWH